MNAFTRTEKLRAEFLSKASVEYETKVGFVKYALCILPIFPQNAHLSNFASSAFTYPLEASAHETSPAQRPRMCVHTR
ncbi:hypothetical protein Q3G72_027550 [Acer saccharum]|nr:hypothetical protein Q3G72_027550 [Acer saccharum]